MSDYLLDGHKLAWHPQAVADWLKGKTKAPIYIEVGPTARCNHRCTFCSFQYVDHKGPDIDADKLTNALWDAFVLGTKSVCFAGEGDPLLHPLIIDICKTTWRNDLDTAMSTNGAFFDQTKADNIIPFLDWLRFSVDAFMPETHAHLHGCSFNQLDVVKENIAYAVSLNSLCTIGVQAILLPENVDEIYDLASWCRDVGVDYFTVKPFVIHPKSEGAHFDEVHILDRMDLDDKLAELMTDRFKIIFRHAAMQKANQPIPYDRCLALDFWAYIDAHGDVYACSAFLGDQNYVYGNINDQSFSEIWNGRHAVQDRIAAQGIAGCRRGCRMDAINRYLHRLVNPPEHVNFI